MDHLVDNSATKLWSQADHRQCGASVSVSVSQCLSVSLILIQAVALCTRKHRIVLQARSSATQMSVAQSGKQYEAMKCRG